MYKTFRPPQIEWFSIVAIIAIAIFIRIRLNFRHDLIPGINGGYYPYQIRHLLENFNLAFKDMPFVFWLEAALAKILILFGSDFDQGIILASKLTDSIVPPLAAIPVFLITKQFKRPDYTFSPFILTAWAILFFPMIFLMTGEIQKNNIGLIWVYGAILQLILWIKEKNKKHLLYLAIFSLLTLLTHFGCMLGLMLILIVFGGLRMPIKQVFKPNSSWYLALIIILMIGLSLAFLDFSRFSRLLSFFSAPLKLFEHPMGLLLIHRAPVLTPALMIYGLIVHISSLLLLLLVLKHRHSVQAPIKSLMLSMALSATLLSTPILGIEWYLRLAILSFVPLLVGIILILPFLRKVTVGIWLGFIMILILDSSFIGLSANRLPSISPSVLEDLQSLKQKKLVGESDLVLAAHGLEWWTAWVLECKIGQPHSLSQDSSRSYSTIYLLVRTDLESEQLRRNQSNFADPPIPKGLSPCWEGASVNLYKVDVSTVMLSALDEISVLDGIVTKTSPLELLVKNQVYEYRIRMNPETQIITSEDNLAITTGDRITVWGRRQAFGLSITASLIQLHRMP